MKERIQKAEALIGKTFIFRSGSRGQIVELILIARSMKTLYPKYFAFPVAGIEREIEENGAAILLRIIGEKDKKIDVIRTLDYILSCQKTTKEQFVVSFLYPEHGIGACRQRKVAVETLDANSTTIEGISLMNEDCGSFKKFLKSKVNGPVSITFGSESSFIEK
jgi:hypothetical protein